MDYENYIELYEAVYLFNKLPRSVSNKEKIYRAAGRILAVNNLLHHNGNEFYLTEKNKEDHQYILENIINKNPGHYEEMLSKAENESQFFFNSISDLEYEIYSRCNFQVTLQTGKEIIKHIDFSNSNVLELGGNSGGLASAVIYENPGCFYTVLDTKIPCMVGREFAGLNKQPVTFIEGNIFQLPPPDERYDYIVFMNLLHDFDDKNCADILCGCLKYCGGNAKLLIIEDILTGELEPKEVIMHGLRLAVECRGGGQRTIGEFSKLFLNMSNSHASQWCRHRRHPLKIERTVKLNETHTLLVIGE